MRGVRKSAAIQDQRSRTPPSAPSGVFAVSDGRCKLNANPISSTPPCHSLGTPCPAAALLIHSPPRRPHKGCLCALPHVAKRAPSPWRQQFNLKRRVTFFRDYHIISRLADGTRRASVCWSVTSQRAEGSPVM